MNVRSLLFFFVLAFSVQGHSAVGDTSRYWPNGSTLNVLFMDGEPELHRSVEKYANEWTQFANIKFRFFSKPKAGRTDHIRIQFAKVPNKTNASLLGTASIDPEVVSMAEPSMWLAEFTLPGKSDERLRRVVLHEFGHVLGLKHEHQSPNFPYEWSAKVMTKCVNVKMEKIIEAKGEAVDEDLVEALADATNKCEYRYEALYSKEYEYTDFDPQAVMMYGIAAWKIKGDSEFFISKSSEISSVEKAFVRKVYPF